MRPLTHQAIFCANFKAKRGLDLTFNAQILHNYSAKGSICGLNSYSYQTAQMSIKLNGINCFYGAHQALFDITLDCPQGETLVLLGPSGAGKSSAAARTQPAGDAAVRFVIHRRQPISTSPERRPIKRFAKLRRTSAWSFSNTTCGRTLRYSRT